MNVRAGTFPAWVHLGVGGLSYGLPTLAGGEMKAAFHRTAGVGGPVPAGFDDPAVAIEPRTQALDDVEADLHLWFSPGPGRRTRQERCFYTNAPADDFLIDRARDLAGVLVVSACSGHAFKLGPWTGTVVAERLLDGT
jgi:sarcosine oxidase